MSHLGVVMRIRMSDNVLEDDDWPVRDILVRAGRIVSVQDIHHGVYSFSSHAPTIGWDMEQLCEWLAHDPTGRHPEQWNEIRKDGIWQSFLKPAELPTAKG